MKARKKKQRIDHSGSTFDSFLEQEGIREEVEAVAIKRVLARQHKHRAEGVITKPAKACACLRHPNAC